MTLRGILLDFNGTLLFDSDFHMEAFRRIFPLYGKPIPDDDFMIQKCFGRTNETIYWENIDPNGTQEQIDIFAKQKETLYQQECLAHPEQYHLTDGAVEFLDYVKEQKIPYCLATGSGKCNVDFYIRHLALSRWFSEENMVYAKSDFPGKPAPDIYCMAAKKIGLSPAECLVLEDGTSGIRAANAAGAGAVHVIYEAKYPSPLTSQTKVNGVCHDLRDWKKLLAQYGLLR